MVDCGSPALFAESRVKLIDLTNFKGNRLTHPASAHGFDAPSARALLRFQPFKALGKAIITLIVFLLILRLGSVVLNALPYQACNNLHLLRRSLFTFVDAGTICKLILHQTNVVANTFPIFKQLTERQFIGLDDLLLRKVRRSTFMLALELGVTLPDHPTVRVVGVPYLGTIYPRHQSPQTSIPEKGLLQRVRFLLPFRLAISA